MAELRLPFAEQLDAGTLHLQRLRYEDAEEIFYAYASKPDATRFVTWPTHNRLADTRTFLRYAVQAWNAGHDFYYSIRLAGTNRLAGSIGAVVRGNEAQVGYVISPALWGRGIATAACFALSGLLKNMPQLARIWTFVDAENTASQRVLQKCGWTRSELKPAYFAFVNQGNRLKDCYEFTLERSPGPDLTAG
ncbi:MAG: acetyltransferase [Cyclobacteriaceae bacterium]|nr:MAG: acetyltransferase [Cyclobacteriaceae bacterium]